MLWTWRESDGKVAKLLFIIATNWLTTVADKLHTVLIVCHLAVLEWQQWQDKHVNTVNTVQLAQYCQRVIERANTSQFWRDTQQTLPEEQCFNSNSLDLWNTPTIWSKNAERMKSFIIGNGKQKQ